MMLLMIRPFQGGRDMKLYSYGHISINMLRASQLLVCFACGSYKRFYRVYCNACILLVALIKGFTECIAMHVFCL